MADPGAILKAYDLRGVVPDELDEQVAEALGGALAFELASEAIVVAHDMRPSSPGLAEALMRGARRQGVDTVSAGLGSTDLLYFASGRLGLPGAMVTASHNPPRYNGVKVCRAGAVPVSRETGLARVCDLARDGDLPSADRAGTHRDVDLLDDFADHARSFIDATALRPLKVAVDAGNGMAGLVAPAVLGPLPVEMVPLHFDLDGTFPNHPPDPLDPANLSDLQRAVVDHGCDAGLAFDGDADRVRAVDERGRAVSPSALAGVIAEAMLRKEPGATVLHSHVCSRALPEAIAAAGGRAVATPVGHSYIKAAMAETDAVFAGEHSGHYYFRDNFRADSGIIAALLLLEALSASGRKLSALAASHERYAASGELNVETPDADGALARVADAFASEASLAQGGEGLTVDGGSWWLNLRASNTEPLLRLNVEAPDRASVERLRDRALAAVRAQEGTRCLP